MIDDYAVTSRSDDQNDVIVSIVIPVYNRPSLIARCLDSCLNQTLPRASYEIIVVDDCSTDNTMDILRDYESRFPDTISVFQLPANSKGASRPRNEGVRRSRGEYIFFMDSDDTILPDTLHDAYELTHGGEADLVIVRARGGGGWIKSRRSPEDRLLTRADWKSTYGTANDFFKRSRLLELSLQFAEHIMGEEDNVFLLEYMFRQAEFKWNILGGKQYYWQDLTRNAKDLGTTSPRYMAGLSRQKIASTFVQIQNDPRLADKADIAMSYLPRSRGSYFDAFLTLGDERFGAISSAFNDLVPLTVDATLSSECARIVHAFRLGRKRDLIQTIHQLYVDRGQLDTKALSSYCKSLVSWKNTGVIIFTVNGSASNNDASNATFWNFQKLGFRSQLHAHDGASYVGVIDRGSILFDELALGAAVTREFEVSGTQFSVASEGGGSGGRCSIKIDGVERSLNQRGVNALIYSPEVREVVDTIVFDPNRRFVGVRAK